MRRLIVPPGSGLTPWSGNPGVVDLSGGYHDAGDYNKFITVLDAGDRLFFGLLVTHELFPKMFPDGSLNIPESSNGVPDLLDVIKIETDWMLKMQLADGRVMAQILSGDSGTTASPPSKDPHKRYHHPPTEQATAYFVAELAGMWTYIRASGATAATVTSFRAWLGDMVNTVMGFSGSGYANHIREGEIIWSSNQYHNIYGLMLALAAREKITGTYTVEQVRARALNFLHYFFGTNPLSLVFMTNAGHIGGERSLYQVYHQWFCEDPDAGGQGTNSTWCGKPKSYQEVGWPYAAASLNVLGNSNTSTYGPAPGLVPGGPNKGWAGRTTYVEPALQAYPKRSFQDLSQRDANWALQKPWEITEIGIYYTISGVMLAAQFTPEVAPAGTCGDGQCTSGETCSSCPKDCGACPDGGPRPGDGRRDGASSVGDGRTSDAAANRPTSDCSCALQRRPTCAPLALGLGFLLCVALRRRGR